MKKNYLLLSLLALFSFAVSCSDDDKDDNNSGVDEKQEAVIREALKTKGLMQSLCDIDTLENGTVQYTPLIGTAIDETAPTVFYLTANTVDEARQKFQDIISALSEDGKTGLDVNEVRQGSIHLTFSEDVKDGETAAIIVDCPELKNVLTEFVFIPEAKWPANGNGSPFNLLSLWRKDGRAYVCVQESDSQDGIMLSLADCDLDPFRSYTYWQGNFDLWLNPASDTAIERLSYVLTYQRKEYLNMLKVMEQKKIGEASRWREIYDWYGGSHSKAYGGSYSYDHGLWWAHYCYYVNIKFRELKCNGTNYSVSQYWKYYEHKETPSKGSPSYSFSFNRYYNNGNGTGWECLYKGT